MTIWQRILRGLVALSSSAMITNIGGVLQAMLTFRYLSTTNYGRLRLSLSAFNIGIVIVTLGIGAVFSAEIAKARGAEQTGRIKSLAMLYVGLLSISGTVGLLVFALISTQRNDLLWIVMGIYLFANAINSALKIIFTGYTAYGRIARQNIIRTVSRLGLLVIIPLVPYPDLLTAVALTYPLMELITLGFSIGWSRPIFKQFLPAVTAPIDMKAIIKEQGGYVLLTMPVKRVIGELPIWILQTIWGETAVGLYGAAHKALGFILIPFAYIEELLFPLVPEQMTQNIDRIRVAMRQTQKYSFWLMVTAVTTTIFLTPWLVQLIAGIEYQDAALVLRWLLPTLLFTPFLQLHRPILFAIKQQKWLMIFQYLSLISYTPLLWWLISQNGVVGAAQALIVNGIFHLTFRLLVIRRVSPELWVSPFTIFRIEPFDRQLTQKLIHKIHKFRANYVRSD